MTPGARLQAAIELLDAAADGTVPVDTVVDAYFKKRRYAGGGDRRAVQARVYDTLRRRARLDWWIARDGGGVKPTPRTQVISDLVLTDKMPLETIEATFSGERYNPKILSDAERELIRRLAGQSLNRDDMPEWVRLEYPEWLHPRLKALWGDNLAWEMTGLNQPAPLDLRANTLKGPWETAHDMLAAEGIDAQATPLSPWGLRVVGTARIGGTKAFRDGFIEVQDEGSQIVALMTDARPGMTVVDFCAGAGGKTLALAAAMAEGGRVKGRLTACDVSAARVARMGPRLKRAGANAVRQIVLDSESDKWVAKNEGWADRVLVDAPCSGTGTWRRDPLARWRLSEADLAQHRERQGRILAAAARLVKPGGRLIYATCSVLAEENEDQILAFTEANKNFRTLSVERLWQETVGGPPPPEGGALRLSPATSGTDGFYIAVMART